jgi:hypothetical protein
MSGNLEQILEILREAYNMRKGSSVRRKVQLLEERAAAAARARENAVIELALGALTDAEVDELEANAIRGLHEGPAFERFCELVDQFDDCHTAAEGRELLERLTGGRNLGDRADLCRHLER